MNVVIYKCEDTCKCVVSGDFNTDDIDPIFTAAFDVLHQCGPTPTDVIHTETNQLHPHRYLQC